jgi:hypothetical protein
MPVAIARNMQRKIPEITSGRANLQQGFATTCKDSWYKGRPRLREDFGLAHEFEVAMRGG